MQKAPYFDNDKPLYSGGVRVTPTVHRINDSELTIRLYREIAPNKTVVYFASMGGDMYASSFVNYHQAVARLLAQLSLDDNE